MTDNVFLLSCPFFRRFFLLLLLLYLLPFQAIPPPPPHTSTELYLLHTRITESRFSRFYQVGWSVGWPSAVFIRCSICRQTRLFRAGHKGTMMSYFVNGRRVRLIESNLGRRSCFFVISHGASYTHPLLLSAFYPLRLERVALSPPCNFWTVFRFFFFFFFTMGRRRRRRKVSDEACRFFFIFSIPPLTSGG